MAEINVYVDPDASGGGTGVDWTNAYTTLNAAEAAEQTDLVTDTDNIIFNCRSSSSGADSSPCNFSGWTTSATYDIQIIGDLTTGIWDDTKYHMVVSTGVAMLISTQYVTIKNVQVSVSGSGSYYALQFGSSYSYVSHSIFKVTAAVQICVIFSSGNNFFFNNIVYDSIRYGVLFNFSGTVTLFNNTVTGCGRDGYAQIGGTITMTNCVGYGNGDNSSFFDFDGTFTNNYCASSDATSDDNGGDGNIINISDPFNDYASDDFSLSGTGSALYNAGTNTGAPSDDIKGTSRPQVTTTDIGAFEFIVTAGGDIVLLRRRREGI